MWAEALMSKNQSDASLPDTEHEEVKASTSYTRGFMLIIMLLAPVSIVSFQATNLAAWWMATLVDGGTSLSVIGKVIAGAISATSFMAKRATPAIRRGLIGDERCS